MLQLGKFLSWNQVKILLDTNNISTINIIESDSQASINMNHSYLIQNQNKELFDKTLNISYAQCNETIGFTNIIFQTKFSRQKNFEDMVIKYLNESKLDNIDIYYSESIMNVIYSVMYNIIIVTVLMNVMNLSFSRLANGMTKNPGKLIKPEDLDVDIKDVIGLTDTKEEILQYIDYMKNREQYLKMGVEIPRGLLFIGPPGCGKTYLAKCIAAEAKVNFISLSGSDFHEMFVGVGAGRMKSLFNVARKNSPSIVFIDEIDSLGQKRSKMINNSENNSVLNKLLVEMDGFENNDNVLLIGATNRHDTLDNALMRSGRFDRKLVFDKPNVEERKEMFELYLKGKILADELTDENKLKILARLTAGLTGADIKTICNQGGIICIREKGDRINYKHLNKAIDEIMVGNEKKERLMSKEEKERVSYHEAGHCLLGSLLKQSEPPIKVSIIPRGVAALGYSMQQPNDKKLKLKEELYATIMVLFGGRIAESLQYGTVSTGAYDDYEKATMLAKLIVTKYCFDNFISVDLQQSGNNREHISENQKNKIYNNIEILLKKLYEQAETLINNNMCLLEKIALKLLEQEEIIKEEIEEMVGDKMNSVDIGDLYYNNKIIYKYI
tara:strand:+ start:2260 stop:4098 length:1839 start_codon:yes stop_codon:yes gene_type:complete